MAGALHVEGLRELNNALARADKATRLGVRVELRNVAKPVQQSAEELARTSINNIGARWSKMRVGVTRDVVYVAPRQRGVKGRDQRYRRPNLAGLLMTRALEPALARNEREVERRFEEMLDRVSDDFNHGGAT